MVQMAHSTQTHTSSTTIIPGHSSTPILHYHRACFLWRISTHVHTRARAHGDGRAQTRNRSLFPVTKGLDTHWQNDRIWNDEKPELFGQKLIDHILLFCSWRRLPVTQKIAGNRLLCVWERLWARASPCLCLCCVCVCDDDVAAAVHCGCKWAFLPLSISYSCINCPRNTRLAIHLWKHMCVGVCSFYVSACVCLHVCKFISYHSFPQVTRAGCCSFFH